MRRQVNHPQLRSLRAESSQGRVHRRCCKLGWIQAAAPATAPVAAPSGKPLSPYSYFIASLTPAICNSWSGTSTRTLGTAPRHSIPPQHPCNSPSLLEQIHSLASASAATRRRRQSRMVPSDAVSPPIAKIPDREPLGDSLVLQRASRLSRAATCNPSQTHRCIFSGNPLQIIWRPRDSSPIRLLGPQPFYAVQTGVLENGIPLRNG
jgi:hypothetical protein